MTEADFAVIDSMLQSSVNKIAELQEQLAVAKSAAESWAATAIAGEARERTAKEELARMKADRKTVLVRWANEFLHSLVNALEDKQLFLEDFDPELIKRLRHVLASAGN